MATMSEKPANVFGPTLSRRQFIKAGGVLVVGFSFVGPELLNGRYREARRVQELARSHPPQLLDRDSPGRHGPDSYREERLRPGLDLHRLPADCGRRVERTLRSDHHGRSGRYRSHAGWQRRLRFSRPWNAEHPQGGRLYLPGSARSRVGKTRRAEGQAFRRRTASFQEAARAFPTATS